MDSAHTDRGAADWVVPGYVHDRELGSGGGGRVVLATHLATGTTVAIKYLAGGLYTGTDFRAAYRTEAALLGEVRSPHVARLYEYVESDERSAIVMEAVEGVSLRALLRDEGATIPEAALLVLKGSLLGLAAAHAGGVVHRDYKPENVLVTPQGISKLVDFGVAARSGATPVAAGTPLYMAPEQFAGAAATPATDVYAATATFFECITGARPYSGTTVMELMIQHTQAPIPDELAPDPVRPLIRAGLAKEPDRRPASAAAFVEQLEEVACEAYGEDWEERGQHKLAALAALLPLLLLRGAASPASGTTALATTDLGPGAPAPKPARRARHRSVKTLAAVGAAIVVTAVIAAVAAAAVVPGPHTKPTAHGPTSGATTSLTPGAPASAPVVTATVSPTSAATPSPSASSPSPSPSQEKTPTTHPATGTTTTPATHTTTTTAPPPPPPLKVVSITITSMALDANVFDQADATVVVKTNGGDPDGTVTFTWSIAGARAPSGSTTDVLPEGRTSVPFSVSFDFPVGANCEAFELTVSSDPADPGSPVSQSIRSVCIQ
jgi:eukaryotic-like serine/threonine-protein kinase